jgi:hypothetical protein
VTEVRGEETWGFMDLGPLCVLYSSVVVVESVCVRDYRGTVVFMVATVG